MERVKNLSRYQQGILIVLTAMMLVFGAIYCVVSSQVGFLYMGEILIPGKQNGATVYTGKIDGKEAEFVVTQDNCVTFRYGEKLYGPYTVTEDPAAVPADEPGSDSMTGIVVREGDEILFRGGLYKSGSNPSDFQLFNEEGWYPDIYITATMSNGVVVDGDGNIVDTMKPTLGTILKLTNGPELVSKGQWSVWLCGVIFSIVTAISVLFADEIFRLNLAFRIRNVDDAEPSDWALVDRCIGWAIGTIGSLVIYIMGLQV